MEESGNISSSIAPAPVDPLNTAEFWYQVFALDTPAEVVLFFGILFVLLILGGNVWVIVAVIRNPKLRSSATNIFIVSLSVTDILVGVVTVPQHVAVWGYFSHVHNNVICKLVAYLQSCSLTGTTLFLICIAVDRYRAIVQPLKPRITVNQALFGCALVWLVGLLYGIAPLYTVGLNPRVEYVGNETYVIYRCGVLYEKAELDAIIRLLDFVVFYGVNLLILAILYGIMISTLWFGKSPSNSSNRGKQKAIKMLGFVVLQFSLTWLPYHALQLYYQYTTYIPPRPLLYSTAPINSTFFIFCCNSWINPILYAYFNENFRKEFVRLFPCLNRKSKVGPTTTGMSVTSKTGNMSVTQANTQVSTVSTA
ncbi:neuropeptide FF receptor 2-like [Saccoglossus kowalevskii]|uniref:Neuropeptide FF receptor 2-like n=1 Tax=Saccoglossus kowalevskii TaxID=10224 RepID=A0ABM0GS87_SACKO|nr:PREDICTED: neuropeptide FF receptor 2-like [Saccoglossus kowalevskii]